MSNSSLVTYTNLSNNHSGKRRYAIDTITPHCVVGQWTAKQGCDYFATTTRQASCNYFVGRDGSIGLCVEEENRAWCSGGTDKNGNPIYVNGISGSMNDHRAITIEVASDTTHPYAITDAAYTALVKLCADICIRNGMPKLLWHGDKSLVGQTDKQNITVHRWFANKACPGDYIYNRLGQLAADVNRIIDGTFTEPEDDRDVVAKGRVTGGPLNVRCGPGMSYNVIGQLAKGTPVEIYKRSDDWYNIKYIGENSWVNKNYVEITQVDQEEDEDDVVRYKYLADIPESNNFRSIIDDLMTAQIINGDGSDPTGNGDVIDLSHDMVRMLIFNYRGGCYDTQLKETGVGHRWD